MSDSYQAIYDAVRSRISNGDIGQAVHDVCWQHFDMSHVRAMAQEQIYAVGFEMMRPSVLWRPTIVPDGTKWSALYGENLMEGVCGFGNTPEEAMADFDNNWWKQKTPVAIRLERKIAEEEAKEAELANGQFGVGA